MASGFCYRWRGLQSLDRPYFQGRFMAVTVEMHNTGDPQVRAEVVAVIEHVLSERAGEWRILIVGSQANDRWEMKIVGPHAFERSYTLEGTAGEHRPDVIGQLVAKMVLSR